MPLEQDAFYSLDFCPGNQAHSQANLGNPFLFTDSPRLSEPWFSGASNATVNPRLGELPGALPNSTPYIYPSNVFPPTPSGAETLLHTDISPPYATINPLLLSLPTQSSPALMSVSPSTPELSSWMSSPLPVSPSSVSAANDSFPPIVEASPMAQSMPSRPTCRKHSHTTDMPIPEPNITNKSRGRKPPMSLDGNQVIVEGIGKQEVRPFVCERCMKAFQRKEHLKRHLRSIHTNQRPWKCPYCNKGFPREDNMKTHIASHHSTLKS